MTSSVFVAIAVPAAVRDDLSAATAALRPPDVGLRATAPAGWHLTLAFLGPLEDGQRDQALTVTERVVADAPRPAPWLTLGAPGRFGDRVLFVEVGDDPPGVLAELAERLRAALRGAGFDLPGTGFQPHVTLARARRGRRIATADVAGLAVPPSRWQPDTVGLWERAGPDRPGPYEVWAEVPWPDAPASPDGPWGAGPR